MGELSLFRFIIPHKHLVFLEYDYLDQDSFDINETFLGKYRIIKIKNVYIYTFEFQCIWYWCITAVHVVILKYITYIRKLIHQQPIIIIIVVKIKMKQYLSFFKIWILFLWNSCQLFMEETYNLGGTLLPSNG